MSTTITFQTPALDELTVNTPQHGYESRIVMAMKKFKATNGEIRFWDNTSTYDARLCKCQFVLNYTMANNFKTFFNDPTKGRGSNVLMTLGLTKTGFFPFGPDYGDIGSFNVRMLDMTVSKQLHAPWKWWTIDCTFVLVLTYQTYSIPTQYDDGNFQVGTVTGLRYPQDGFDQNTKYGMTNLAVFGGGMQETDKGIAGDTFGNNFDITANNTKASALVYYLVNTARGNQFNVITDTNYYAFGIHKNATATFACRLEDNEIVVNHYGYNQFRINMKLGFVSQT